jgi:hypothetical protein
MAEKIVIAELELNTKSLQDSNTKIIQQIAVLREAQKNLKTETGNLTNATEEQSRAFIENDAQLKALNTEYANNKKVLAENTTGIRDLAEMLSKETATVGEAEKVNKRLSIIRSQITTDTQAGRDAIEEINEKIDKNTVFIKENSDAQKQQVMNVGNYKEAITEAFQELNIFNGGIGGFIQRSQEAGGVGPMLKNAFMGISTGINAATKSAWGFVANPIGAIIAALAITLGILYSVFKSFTPVVDKAEQAVAAIGAVLNVVKNTVIALVTGTKSLTEAFSGLGDSMKDAANDAANLKKAQQDLEDAMEQQEVQTAKTRAEINRLNIQAKDRTKSEEERLALLNKAAKLEEQDFQQRKKISDEKLRIAYEEIRISADLSEQEFQQLKKSGLTYKEVTEQKATNQDELYENLKEALLKSTEVENEFYSNQEKIINKQNKLIEDQEAEAEKNREKAIQAQEKAIQLQKEKRDKEIAYMNDELSLFIAKESLKKKTLEESLSYEDEVSKKRISILDKEYEYGKISKQKYEEQKILIDVEAKRKQAEIAVKALEDEVALFKLQNESKLAEAKTLTEYLVNEEAERLQKIYDQDVAINQKRLADKLISEQEYQIKSLELEQSFEEQKLALKKQYDEQLRAELALQRALDFETQTLEQESRNASEFEKELSRIAFEENEKLLLLQEIELPIKEAKLASELEAKEANLITEEEYNNRKLAIESTYQQKVNNVVNAAAIARNKVNQAVNNAQLQGAAQVAGGLAQLAGEQSALGKAFGIAQATINTYQGATMALATLPPPYGGIAAAVTIASGLASVAKIMGVKGAEGAASGLGSVASGVGQIGSASIPKAEKGALFNIGGNRHSAGGTKFYGEDGTTFEAERGEILGVMNRNASKAFMDFNNSYPSVGSTRANVFASGGIAFRQNMVTQQVESALDVDLLASKIAESNRSLPSPIVGVTDIIDTADDYNNVVQMANLK